MPEVYFMFALMRYSEFFHCPIHVINHFILWKDKKKLSLFHHQARKFTIFFIQSIHRTFLTMLIFTHAECLLYRIYEPSNDLAHCRVSVVVYLSKAFLRDEALRNFSFSHSRSITKKKLFLLQSREKTHQLLYSSWFTGRYISKRNILSIIRKLISNLRLSILLSFGWYWEYGRDMN